MSKVFSAAIAIAMSISLAGCSKKEDAAPAPAASTSDSAPPAASASAPPAAPSETASAAPPAAPHDCPKGSSGDGTFDKPCDASKNARMMDVQWNGKIDDKGPYFKVQNKSTQTILFGRIAVYFYDKAGKQLDVPAGDDGKTTPYRTCAGNIFSGVMKPNEKAVLSFSCVAKKHVPDGTTAIEAEMQGVGFADSTEKKVEYYWRNKDLAPDARKKGGSK
jgi:hypothetical protein